MFHDRMLHDRTEYVNGYCSCFLRQNKKRNSKPSQAPITAKQTIGASKAFASDIAAVRPSKVSSRQPENVSFQFGLRSIKVNGIDSTRNSLR